jgi:ATP-dependent RNA circularization protein (DNA/RNA ligase family)
MNPYHKINSIFKRDEKTNRFIENEWSRPEFEYLKKNAWIGEEKIDGTNIRVQILRDKIILKGRSDNAHLPTGLIDRLLELFTIEKVERVFEYVGTSEICLYGEGVGSKIQKGRIYVPHDDAFDFILFDVMIDGMWLTRASVEDIARGLGIRWSIPVFRGTLADAIERIKQGIRSEYDESKLSEGLVLRPEVDILCRNGERVITKIKHCDYGVKILGEK